MDAFRHHRQIAIVPTDEGSGWQAVDCTIAQDGEPIAVHTVFLGVDEDGELIWPAENRMLLAP